ncbi:MAG: hypothetical protein KF796_07410 [Ramlibacter sp.]|nr:hypothetical protein [Ramlibacter sp.]
MAVVVICERTFLAKDMLVALLPAAFVFFFAIPFVSVVIALVLSLILYAVLGWLAFVWSRRTVTLDPEKGKVVVSSRSYLFKELQSEFPVQRFGSVVSYYPMGRNAPNCVSLMDRSGDRGILIGSFSAGWKSKSFWSWPTIVESEQAQKLRAHVSSCSRIGDGGYVGVFPRVKELK